MKLLLSMLYYHLSCLVETLKGDGWFKLSTARASGKCLGLLILNVLTIPHNREDH